MKATKTYDANEGMQVQLELNAGEYVDLILSMGLAMGAASRIEDLWLVNKIRNFVRKLDMIEVI